MEQKRGLRCLIAAGGTFGHVGPSLAVAEALRTRGVQVTFAGSPDRVEARLVPEAGFELDGFRAQPFPRRLRELEAAAALASAPIAALRIVRRRRPHVVLGGGGYVSGPVVLAAALTRTPVAVMEADAELGLANRLAAPLARRVFLAFPLEDRHGSKYRVTGRPIPARSKACVAQHEARARFELPADGPLLLVFGGSQGAHSLNEAMVEAFAAEGPAVLHLTGDRDYGRLRARVSRPDYRLLPFTDDFGSALAAADLAVARAGGSVWELAAAGLPAVLVPYPHATADHQAKNARYFTDAGGALIVPDERVRDVPAVVRSLLEERTQLTEMGRAMQHMAKPRAADDIAEELIALGTARG